jgi:hypothetical protein
MQTAKTSKATVLAAGPAGYLRAAILGLAITAAIPAISEASSIPTPSAVVADSYVGPLAEAPSLFFDMQTPALTPGLPPPQLSSLSDRRIVAGLILVLFAGLSAFTYTMWRELGRRIQTR